MFLDQAVIQLKGGDGGNGVVAFRREIYVPEGGPAGGNGGDGGNVIMKVDRGMRTLIDFRYQKNHHAPLGGNGASKRMHGRNGDDLYLKVPPGTRIYNNDTNEMLADLTTDGQEYIVSKGGRGGRGNIAFASSRNPAPHISENGEPGQEITVRLELMLLADVGFVGFPSVGKSTLLSVMTTAKPKIAEYHFTTLSPQLGVAKASDDRTFVIADLPGLIEGAHLGHGLGIQFLKHIERTKVIVHVLDMSALEGRSPYEDFQKIKQELSEFDEVLLERKQIIVANKMDVDISFENLEQFKQQLSQDEQEITIVEVSGMTQFGINVLKLQLANILDELTEQENYIAENAEPIANHITYTLSSPPKHKRQKHERIDFEVKRNDYGEFLIVSDELEKLYKMTNMNYHESVMRFLSIVRKAGVEKALKDAGANEGDAVWISDFVFEYVEEEFDN